MASLLLLLTDGDHLDFRHIVVVLHCVVPLKTRLRAHSNTTNGTAVDGLHFLDMDLAS